MESFLTTSAVQPEARGPPGVVEDSAASVGAHCQIAFVVALELGLVGSFVATVASAAASAVVIFAVVASVAAVANAAA